MTHTGVAAKAQSGGSEGYRPKPDPARHPVFQWPIKPSAIFMYLFGFPGFLWPYATSFLMVALVWGLFFIPEQSRMKDLSVGWVASLLAGNLALLVTFVSLLHVWLYVHRAQGTQYKYNTKWLSVGNPSFLFRSQLWDNVFWTVCFAVPIWSAYEAITFWLQANGLAPTVSWHSHPVYCVVLLLVTQLWIDVHFFTSHRLLHWPPLFRAVHSLHHRNVNTGPWSGLAMHPAEHAIYFSGVVLFWVIPSNPLHTLYLLFYLVLGDIVGHHGFDRVILGSRLSLDTNHYMHYLHHKYVTVNYGTGVLPFDRLCGTFHDGSEESMRSLKDHSRGRPHRSGEGGNRHAP